GEDHGAGEEAGDHDQHEGDGRPRLTGDDLPHGATARSEIGGAAAPASEPSAGPVDPAPFTSGTGWVKHLTSRRSGGSLAVNIGRVRSGGKALVVKYDWLP